MKHLPTLALLYSAATFVAASVSGAEPDVTSLSDAFSQGKVSLNTRLRWESADQSNLRDSDAFTLGTRLGFTTAPLQGFQAMLEADNVLSLGDTDDYNAAGTNPGGAGHTVIADPEATGVNQAWLAYTADNTTFKVGRQRINLENTRYVGDGAWRQNMQTFDTASVTFKPEKDYNFYYGYVWRVNRPLGNKAPQRDFKGDAHFLNAEYSGFSYGKLSAYAYLLDFDNSAANSSNTFGASFAGSTPVNADFKVSYRVEYAMQRDAGNNPLNYDARYYNLELGGAIKPFDVTFGYEVLGSDHGTKGFATPLGNLHPFNGWADVFTATPAAGLNDLSVSVGVALPNGFPVKVAYHDYASDYGSVDLGSEWDATVTHKIGKNWTLLAKFADYHAGGAYFDTRKFWLSVAFDY